MEPTNNNTNPSQPASAPAQSFQAAPVPLTPPSTQVQPIQDVKGVEKHKLSILNWGVLILVILTLLTWFYPPPADCGYRGAPEYCHLQLPEVLGMPVLILSFIVGSLFLAKMLMITNEQNAFMKASGLIIGLLGGGFFFIVGLITSLVGMTRSTGSV